LAADASWQQLLTDAAGTVTGVGPAQPPGHVPDPEAFVWRYRPSTKLARLVRARDGQCRYPGCGVTAVRCDLDHVVPFDHDNPTPAVPPPQRTFSVSADGTTA